jgi:hypothetical protein
MSEQQAPLNGDTPAVAGPIEAPGTQDQPPYGDPNDPYEKRYTDLRSWTDRVASERAEFSRKAQELEQKQQWYELLVTSDDPDTRRQAAEVLGYELPQEEEPEPAGYEDPYETLAQRTERLEQRYEQDQASRYEAERGAIARSVIDERLSAMPDLPEGDQDWILAHAIHALPPVYDQNVVDSRGQPVPLPDLQNAAQAWQAREVERQKAWAKTKRAPYVPSGGRSANEVPDPGTGHNARRNRAMQFLHDNTGDE